MPLGKWFYQLDTGGDTEDYLHDWAVQYAIKRQRLITGV